MPSLRIIFAGSPAAAVPSLQRLINSAHDVVAVVTREDAPLGRKKVLTATPVARAAEAAAIPVVKANRLAPVSEQLGALNADLGVIVAYGGLIREPLLSGPRAGWINLHFSLLPRWRGAAPVQRALMAGDSETGAAVFQLVPELDAGPVFATVTQPIGAQQTAGHLLGTLAESGAELLGRVVDALADGTAVATPQHGEVTVAPKLSLGDGRLDWNVEAERVIDRFRGTTPEPGAFTEIDGERIKVLDAVLAHNASTLAPGHLELREGRLLIGSASDPIELLVIHPAGRKAMPAVDWWRGRPSGSTVVAS